MHGATPMAIPLQNLEGHITQQPAEGPGMQPHADGVSKRLVKSSAIRPCFVRLLRSAPNGISQTGPSYRSCCDILVIFGIDSVAIGSHALLLGSICFDLLRRCYRTRIYFEPG